jgi:hypothetical protein
MADWKKIVLATGTSTQYIKGDGTFATYTDSLPLTGGTVTGDVIIKNNNGNASQTLLILRNNDNTSNTEKDQTAELEFQFKGTTDSGVSFDTKNAGKIVAGKDTDYFTASADNMDSHLKFYTSQDNVNTLALTIDSSQNATFANDIILGGDISGGSDGHNIQFNASGSQLYFLQLTRSTTSLTTVGDVDIGGKIVKTGELYINPTTNLRLRGNVITFGNAGGTSEFARFDSSGNLGIGVSPTVALDISGSTNLSSRIRTTKSGTGKILQMGADRDTSSAPYIGSESGHAFDIITNNTNRMRIDSSGNVVIGQTTAQQKFEVHGGGIRIAGNIATPSSGVTGALIDYFGSDTRFWSRGADASSLLPTLHLILEV